ncbi:hypothetical protein [Cesiribacter sp. SM1]|uniref:hypothetical protein n=1 Tax=Cesiribacter sp. SM1 TaxID=2861196 RepID=UPI001CD65B8C|nr:hypothetical protein [Cesiribacter sp. SM1]
MNINEISAKQLRLLELSEQEHEIYKKVYTNSGSIEQLNRYLQQQGIFDQYRQIHAEYVALCCFKTERYVRNEALKRAIFLSWYAEVEPASFTGLADLWEDKITEAYFALNRIIEKGWMNEELAWMLTYYSSWDWVILQYTENKIHAVTKWVRAINAHEATLPLGLLPKGTMDKRGLMGLYFKELGVEQA